MALTLQNLTGFSAGVTSDETGCNIRSFKTVVEPEFRNVVPGKTGEGRGFVIAPMKKNVTIDGEVTGATGVMAATATTAYSASNSSAYFGAPTTGLYLLRGEVTESRDNGALKEMSAEFEALAGIA